MTFSLENQFISDTYHSVLHTNLSAIPANTVVDVNDGVGQKSSLSIGLSGEGASITGKLTAGNLEYPENNVYMKFIDWLYPVNSVIFTVDPINPETRFVGTSWTRVSEGRFLVGAGEGTDKNNSSLVFEAENNLNGEYGTKITLNQIPDHFHHIANNISDHGLTFNSLNPDTYLQKGGVTFVSTYAYELEGSLDKPTVGKTSGVVGRSNSQDTINTINPSYGLYVWKRTS